MATPPPPDLVDTLLSIKGVLIPIGLIGVAKLVVVAVQWNYKTLDKFVKKTKPDSFTASVLRAQRKRQARKLERLNNPRTKTDSANFWAWITTPFSRLFAFFKGFF